jgi:hypothetical protein
MLNVVLCMCAGFGFKVTARHPPIKMQNTEYQRKRIKIGGLLNTEKSPPIRTLAN